MPYSDRYNYNSYNEFFKKRDCRNKDKWGSFRDYDRPTYGSDYGRYYGPLEWFPEAANAVLEWFLEPTNRHDHQELYHEITTGDSFDGFMEHGQKQEGLIKFYVLLCIIALVGGLMFVGGVGWKLLGKKQVDPSNDKKRRAKLVPLFFFHIPLAIVLGVLLAFFSTNLWALYSGMIDSTNPADDAARGANTDLKNMIKRGNCEYDTLIVEGVNVINKQMDDFFLTQLQRCEDNATLSFYDIQLRKDKGTLFYLKESAESVGYQLEELQEITKNDERKSSFGKMSKALIKLQKELDIVYKGFDKEIEDVKRIQETRNADIEELHKKLKESSQPLSYSLEEIQTRLKVVVDSIHGAVTEETKWINVLGERMSKLKTQVKQQGNPLTSFILIQLLIAVPVILAILALCIAFLALAVRIVYPEAFTKFPGANRKTRRYITVSFFTQCVIVGLFAVVTWVSLNYAASLNVSCKPLYSTGYFIDPMNNFYKDVLGSFRFKNFDGNEINQTFADAVIRSRDGDRGDYSKNAKLIPNLSELVAFDRWFREFEKTFQENPVKAIQFEDRNKITKNIDHVIAEFKDQNSVLVLGNSPSQLAKLVGKQLQELERQLSSLSFRSLNAVVFKGCGGSSFDSSITKTLQSIFESSIRQYEYMFHNKVYHAEFIYHSYIGTGQQMCVDWRYPLSGLWLAGTLLCVALLVSALVLFKVAKNLYPVGSEDTQVMSDSISVSTIYAPLIDGEKNLKVQEI